MNGSKSPYSVTIKNLEKHFGDFVAVNRVSFYVKKGEIFGFLGPNGAGKSTIIRMLCGLLIPTAGEGTVAGFDIFSEAEHIKTRIGYMSQKFSLYEDLTVEENIDFYSGIYRVEAKKKPERKNWVLEMADLSNHRNTRTGILSAGWKQRLALGCAVLHEPAILFLDEPTSGVDPISRRNFWEMIYRFSEQGITVFVTTHYMDEAEYCDRIGLIYRGELIALDTPRELKIHFMKEDVLEIFCDRPQEAIDFLLSIPGVQEAALFGIGLHVVVKNADQVRSLLEQTLKINGFTLQKMEKISPAMEDVFVSLIEARDRRERPLKEVAR